jgi:hypothetical protein
MRMRPLATSLLGIFLLAVLASGSSKAVAAEPIAIPTTATIFAGKLIDRTPNPPSSARPGSTRRLLDGVSIPFYGRISSSRPACLKERDYQFGWRPGSYPGLDASEAEFSFGPGSNRVPESGKWHTELEETWSRPLRFAIRVLPKKIVHRGLSYLCEETVSPEIVVDKSDFTPCKLARAAKRGYAPVISLHKRLLREAEANDWPIARRYHKDLKRYRSYWPGIKRAVARRC